VRQSGSGRQQGQGQGQHQHQQPQHDQWHEQALRMRRQQLAAALQVVRPSKATDGVIERLSGAVLWGVTAKVFTSTSQLVLC
jgi:hypothetical protein